MKNPAVLDRLADLLDKFRVRANLFHAGLLCGHNHFAAQPGRAFLHVLKRGQLEVHHPGLSQPWQQLQLQEPSLLFYARPIEHLFINPPVEGSDFVCATLDFDGGEHNPLVQALPAVIALPLAQAPGLNATLDLLFAETEQLRCGSRVLADRLFEVLVVQLLRELINAPAPAGIHQGMLAGLADPRLAKLLIALHRAPAEDWDLVKMANLAGMSRSAFAAHFKQVLGSTPANYLSDWRLTQAIALMRAGKPLQAVADQTGFANLSGFSKAFKQRFGVSPSMWLKRA